MSAPADPDTTVEQLRADVEAFVDENWIPDLTVGEWWRVLSAAGFASPSLPESAGGRDFGRALAAVVSSVLAERQVLGPPTGLGRMLAAPTIAAHGSPDQIDRFIPEILDGSVGWCQLFSEPNAGSDLAGLQCKADRDGDEWVISGQKVWTSGGQVADWGMLLARTDPDAPKHKGISILIVPIDSEGIEVAPLNIMGGSRSNITFYNDVRVPVSSIVGEENMGWRYITTQLDFERIAISPIAQLERVFDWLCDKARDGTIDISEGWTRATLARMSSELNALKVMDMKLASMVANGEIPVHEASLLKVLSNEFRVTFSGEVLQMLGEGGLLRRESPGAHLDSSDDAIERQLRESTILLFGGGSNDVQRDIIATHGLGLPR